MGPAPQIHCPGLAGESSAENSMFPVPFLLPISGERRHPDYRQDGTRDDVPILVDFDRNDRLDI
jgi:hypothetical protein